MLATERNVGDLRGAWIDAVRRRGQPDEEVAYKFLGYQSPEFSAPRGPYSFPYADFLRVLNTAGDVNGDGFADTISRVSGNASEEPGVAVTLGPPRRSLWARGSNAHGQLGDGTTTDSLVPKQIGGVDDWAAIATKEETTLALKFDGSLWGWGKNADGQIGDGTTTDRHLPTLIGPDNDWTSLAAGASHTVALKRNGSLWAWGSNAQGQLGDGTTNDRHSPRRIGTASDWASVGAGLFHTLAVRLDGTLWAWGKNSKGQLGNGTLDEEHAPVRIGLDDDWATVAAGTNHSFGIKSTGVMWAWGSNEYGQLGVGHNNVELVPVGIYGLGSWDRVSPGWYHTTAVRSYQNKLYTWGANGAGQLGINSTGGFVRAPQEVQWYAGCVASAGGQHHSAGIKTYYELMYGWGANDSGQLGIGSTVQKNFPTQVGDDRDWIDVAAGSAHTVALRRSTAPEWVVRGVENVTSSSFADVVGSAGDINGDGYGDIIVTDPRHDGRPNDPGHWGEWGRVYIWLGGPPSPLDPIGLGPDQTPETADIILEGYRDDGWYREYAVGDIDGDGYSDLAVGNIVGAACWDDSAGEYIGIGAVTVYISGFEPPDDDDDGISNSDDNCPQTANPQQEDADGDSRGDVCDNCPDVPNLNQSDGDFDGLGDACDNCPQSANDDQVDGDGDLIGDACDNCPSNSNADQNDADGDDVGNVCDNCPDEQNPDQVNSDGDTVGDACDNCPNQPNQGQADADGDDVGNLCDNCPDVSNSNQANGDGDGLGDACDNCPQSANNDQVDGDGDLIGDVCDNCPNQHNQGQADADGDDVGNLCDNCPGVSNPNQVDGDGDLIGDVCDNCPGDSNADQNDADSDNVGDVCDNCPDQQNPDQVNSDGDTLGDSCDNCPNESNQGQADADGDDVGNVCDNCPDVSNSNQADGDSDGLGDACDNCPAHSNPGQADCDDDGEGDVCAIMSGTSDDCQPDGVPDECQVVSGGVSFGDPEPLSSNAATDSGADGSAQVTTDGTGNWVAVWSSNDTLGGTIFNDWDIFTVRSDDNGMTWTEPAPLNNNAAWDGGHDGFAQVTTDGAGNWVAVWHSNDRLGGLPGIGNDMDILTARSADNGMTWTYPTPLNSNAATDSGADASAQVTTDGTGNWVAVWTSSDTLGGTIDNDDDILTARSVDNGLTWTDPAPLNNNAATDSGNDRYAELTTNGGGNWLAVWYSGDTLGGTIGSDDDILTARSVDNGLTWTDPAPLNNNAAADSGWDNEPQVTTDGSGNWVALWRSNNDLGGTIGTDSDILTARSVDNGLTWTDPAPLNSNAATDWVWESDPQLTSDGGDNWVAVWKSPDDLGGTIGTDSDILLARSVDDGLTWTDPVPLNRNAATDSGNDQGGQVTTDGHGHWLAVWSSDDDLGGTIGTDIDIFVAWGEIVASAPDCNHNGTPDECDPDCNFNGLPDECEAITQGDFYGDGDVGLDDHQVFVGCMAGPGVAPNPAVSECVNSCLAAFDFEPDGDVDLLDFAHFKAVFTGGDR